MVTGMNLIPECGYLLTDKYPNKITNSKIQIPNKTQLEEKIKIYDLEERTALFAERVRDIVLKLPGNVANIEYRPQLLRAGNSPGSNYIEANENLGEKDFKMKIKICRKESKEAAYWLRLIITDDSVEMEEERRVIRQEAIELKLIFTAILKKRAGN